MVPPVADYMGIAVAVFVLYVLLNLAIGVWGKSKTKSVRDYYFASHSVGPWAIALAYGATCYSATLIIGYGGLSYKVGASMLWVAASNLLIMTFLAWVVLGKRVRRMQENLGSFTVTELLASRYDAPRVRPLLAVIVLFSMMAYSVAVFSGTARLFEGIFEIDYVWALVIIVAVIGFYITLGGMVATIYTNFFQGIVMVVGMVVLVAGVVSKVGFLSSYASLARLGLEYVSMPGKTTYLSLISLCLVTSLIPWGMPQVITMLYAAKNARAIRLAVPIVTTWSFIVLFAVYFAGPASRIVLGGDVQQDLVMPALFRTVLPPLGIGVVLTAVMAASMSTAAATTLQAAFAFTRDLLQPSLKLSDDRILAISKASTMAAVLVAFALSSLRLASIADIFNFGAAASCAAFVPPLVCGLFWRRGTGEAFRASVGAGFLAVLLWTAIFGMRGEGFYGIQAIIPGQVVGWCVFLGVSLFSEPPPTELVERALKKSRKTLKESTESSST